MKKFHPTKIWFQLTTLQHKNNIAILGLMIISMAIGNLPSEMEIIAMRLLPAI